MWAQYLKLKICSTEKGGGGGGTGPQGYKRKMSQSLCKRRCSCVHHALPLKFIFLPSCLSSQRLLNSESRAPPHLITTKDKQKEAGR